MFRHLPVVKKAIEQINENIPTTHIRIHDTLYDVTNFKHPGAQIFIEMTKGCDATLLFETHHINYEKALGFLKDLPHIEISREEDKMLEKYDFKEYDNFRKNVLELFPTRDSRKMGHVQRIFMKCIFWATFVIHIQLLESCVFSFSWFVLCVVSAFFNSFVGGYGHNGVHNVSPWSIGLDWNGLSSYEWLHEHVHSHHMYTNTEYDHDAISMLPFISWIPNTSRGYVSVPLKHFIYIISELAVAFNGNFVHRARWRLFDSRLPIWMRFGPILFMLRCFSYMFAHGLYGVVSLIFTLGLAGYYFSYLAHLTHVYGGDGRPNFLKHQLMNTKDIKVNEKYGFVLLFLDRQTLHHLIPTVDHTKLTKYVKVKLGIDFYMEPYSWVVLAKKTNNVIRGKFD